MVHFPFPARFMLHLFCVALVLGTTASAKADIVVYEIGNPSSSNVGSFNGTTGAAISSPLVNSGLSSPRDVIYDGAGGILISDGSRIKKYDATTGAVINANFITGLTSAKHLAISGSNLYVSDSGIVRKYDSLTGSVISSNFVDLLGANSSGVAVDGSGNLFVGDYTGRIGKYNATTGAAINASFISGLGSFGVEGIAVDSSNNLFAARRSTNLSKFDATTGATINADFVTGLGFSFDVDVDNMGGLYVSDNSGGKIGKYSSSTGSAINANLITGGAPTGIDVDVSAVPEPTTVALSTIGGLGLLFGMIRRRRQATVGIAA